VEQPEYSAENQKLPSLLARDIESHRWTLDRFAGKTTNPLVASGGAIGPANLWEAYSTQAYLAM
jgi:hypothetical protein